MFLEKIEKKSGEVLKQKKNRKKSEKYYIGIFREISKRLLKKYPRKITKRNAEVILEGISEEFPERVAEGFYESFSKKQ